MRNDQKQIHIQTRTLNEVRDLEKLEKLNPKKNKDSPTQILSNFKWTDSTLQTQARKTIGALLVNFTFLFHAN